MPAEFGTIAEFALEFYGFGEVVFAAGLVPWVSYYNYFEVFVPDVSAESLYDVFWEYVCSNIIGVFGLMCLY